MGDEVKTLRRIKPLKLLLVAVSIIGVLFALEAVLQIANYPKRPLSGWKTLDSYKSERHQLGFRGQPIEYAADDFVILLVGDSQVEAKACAYAWMPESRLEAYLNAKGKKVKVFSLGGPATGQDQQLLSLQEYFEKFRADLVILWFTPANDVWNNTFPSGTPDDRTPKPTFWLEHGELRGPTERTGQPIRESSSIKLILLWRRLFPWSREKEWARFLPQPYSPATTSNGPVTDDWQKRLDASPTYLKYENFDTDKNDRALHFTPSSPRVQYGLDLTRRLLQEIQKSVTARGGQFLIFSVGDDPAKAKDQSNEPNEIVHVVNGKYYKTSRAQYQQNLRRLTEGFNAQVVPVTVEPANVGPEDAHLNEHAVDQVMRDLAAKIEPLVPKP